MKKYIGRKLLFVLAVLLAALQLTSCGKEAERVFDAGQYVLTELTLDGEALDVPSVYPDGAYLLLSSDGTGRLLLGDQACDVPWQYDGSIFRLQINSLAAEGGVSEGSLLLTMPEAGLDFVFTAGSIPPQAQQGNEQPELTPLQADAYGDWTGRLWFELPQGEWDDYLYRTLGLTATVTAEEDGTGRISLWNSFYSEIVPMAQIDVEYLEDEQRLKCCGGWFMSYPVTEWGISISLQEELSSEIEDTVIMHPDVYEYGHYYKSEEGEPTPEALSRTESVLRLKGKCSDGDGSFEYSIVLRRGES